jgi:fucose permease
MNRSRTQSLDPRVVLYSGFVLTGIVTTVLGPVLPWLSTRWLLSDATAGSLFTVQFAGGLAGGAIAGMLASIAGTGRTLAAGYVLMAIGLLTMAMGDKAVGTLAIAVAGLGFGFVSPLTNLTSARLSPMRAAGALGAVNLCWGFGAAMWPLIVATSDSRWGVRSALMFVSALIAAMAVPFVVARFPSDVPHAESSPGHTQAATLTRLATLGLCIALYSGTEASIGGWVTEFARRMAAPLTTNRWEFAASAFWGGLTAGRAAVAVWLTRRWEVRAMFVGLGVLAAGLALLLAARHVELVLAAAALCGLGLGPVFPVTVAALARGFPTRMAGPMVAMGSLGAATLPWLVGALSGRAGSLSVGFAALEGCVALLTVLQVVRVRAHRHEVTHSV